MAEIQQFEHFDVNPGEITTIRFTAPRLADELLLDTLRKQLVNYVTDHPPQKLLLDFTRVEFFSSTLINRLLEVKGIVTKKNPGQLKLGGVRGDVKESFTILQLHKGVFDIFDSVDDAREAFN